ncbi:hypothetical protein SAY86_020103 [Trapa natans]|uniref:60S acidic ribosomal protein p1 n=1 Tax=Trapa natans TaxID=22666 RepID=A0AAN7LP87_TRANT|nr:hypothetical protein SAY86_020103 [Trapa natans]
MHLRCMILHDDGIPITAEKIATLVKVENVFVESYWPNLLAKLSEKRNIEVVALLQSLQSLHLLVLRLLLLLLSRRRRYCSSDLRPT